MELRRVGDGGKRGPGPCPPKGPDLDVAAEAGVKLGSRRGPGAREQKRLTWRGPEAQAACEVILESGENGRHVRLHLVQVHDVLHQGRVDADPGRLALGPG